MLNLLRYKRACFFQLHLCVICLALLLVPAAHADEYVENLRAERRSLQANATTVYATTNESYTNWTEKFLTCEENYKKLELSLIPPVIPWWSYLWRISASVLLILMSGLFSGLTLGLCGLDISQLRIIIDADPESKDAKNAKKIYPLRKDGNLLLCTLLLGNVAVNSALAIILGDLTSGAIGFITSTAIIVVFGEIVPQSLCSRYALLVGGKSVPIVYVFTYLLYIVAKPIALVLDKILGDEVGTIYNNKQLEQVVEFHKNNEAIDDESAAVLKGALRYQQKEVSEVMTPLDRCFMLCEDRKLDFETISQVFQAGHSRIPVYSAKATSVPPTRPEDIVGLLFTKDLILLDPEDATLIKNVINFFSRTIHKVTSEQHLGQVLNQFKQGNTHMSLVVEVNTSDEEADPFYELKGIVTLEDIIEEILGAEILDETDRYVHMDKGEKDDNVVKRKKFDYAKLRLWDDRAQDLTILEEGEINVATTFLMAQPQFKQQDANGRLLKEEEIRGLVADSEVITVMKGGDVYQRKKRDQFCSLILDGELDLSVGADEVKIKRNKFQVLAAAALDLESRSEPFVSDFSATVCSDTCRLLRISRADFFGIFDGIQRSPKVKNLGSTSPKKLTLDGTEAEGKSTDSQPSAGSDIVVEDVIEVTTENPDSSLMTKNLHAKVVPT